MEEHQGDCTGSQSKRIGGQRLSEFLGKEFMNTLGSESFVPLVHKRGCGTTARYYNVPF